MLLLPCIKIQTRHHPEGLLTSTFWAVTLKVCVGVIQILTPTQVNTSVTIRSHSLPLTANFCSPNKSWIFFFFPIQYLSSLSLYYKIVCVGYKTWAEFDKLTPSFGRHLRESFCSKVRLQQTLQHWELFSSAPDMLIWVFRVSLQWRWGMKESGQKWTVQKVECCCSLDRPFSVICSTISKPGLDRPL